MIRRLLATTATSAILLLAAIVALEALGLIFRGGSPPGPVIASIQRQDTPEERAVALLWEQQEAEDLLRARRDAEQQRRREADFGEAARQAADEGRKLADALRWAENYRRQREAPQRVAATEPPQQLVGRRRPEAAAPAEPKPSWQDAPAPVVAAAVPEGGRPSEVRLAEVGPPRPTSPQVNPAPVELPLLRPHRAKSNPASAGRRRTVRCPFLAWVEAVIAPPAASAYRAGQRRGANLRPGFGPA